MTDVAVPDIPAICHRSAADLEAALDHIGRAPVDVGSLDLIVCRPDLLARAVPARAHLDVVDGLVGDSWVRRPSRTSADGGPDPLKQLNVMSSRVIAAIAGEVAAWPGAGDQLFVDLDLSTANLPAGSRLRIGSAVIEVTPAPHTGCAKFRQRYGADALRFLSAPAGDGLRLRGLCARVVTAGDVGVGDEVVVVRR